MCVMHVMKDLRASQSQWGDLSIRYGRMLLLPLVLEGGEEEVVCDFLLLL